MNNQSRRAQRESRGVSPVFNVWVTGLHTTYDALDCSQLFVHSRTRVKDSQKAGSACPDGNSNGECDCKTRFRPKYLFGFRVLRQPLSGNFPLKMRSKMHLLDYVLLVIGQFWLDCWRMMVKRLCKWLLQAQRELGRLKEQLENSAFANMCLQVWRVV